MGRQIVGIDSSILIYVFENNPIFLVPAKKILSMAELGVIVIIFSTVGIIEVLTGPKKFNQKSLVSEYKQKLNNFPNLQIKNLSDSIIELASDLRAKYNLRTPDAIHIATAIESGATIFYTNDKKLKVVKEIKVKTLSS